MQNLVRDKYEISASFVRDKCVTNRVEYFVFASYSHSKNDSLFSFSE